MVEKALKNPNYQDQSLEQILNNIKEVIINHSPNTEVLELTDRILESTDAFKIKPGFKSKDSPVVGFTNENISFLSLLQKKNVNHEAKAKINGLNDDLPNNERKLSSTERLISFKAASESMKAFKNFLKAKEKHDVEKIALRSGITLEELIIEMLKPQLSDWLNKNLPDIVNNIVQREIKKLIPKDE